MIARQLLRLTAVAGAASLLAGCISVFPDADPSQLYRFEGALQGERATARAGTTFGVFLPSSGFTEASSGDRLLTTTGTEAAYIANARWVAPAEVLFQEAVERAFDANPGPARLVGRGGLRQSERTLRLDVRRFEANYDNGQKAPPEIIVRVQAILVSRNDRSFVGEQTFEARVRADANRVSEIVEAFDEATAEVLTELVDWTNRTAAPAS